MAATTDTRKDSSESLQLSPQSNKVCSLELWCGELATGTKAVNTSRSDGGRSPPDLEPEDADVNTECRPKVISEYTFPSNSDSSTTALKL